MYDIPTDTFNYKKTNIDSKSYELNGGYFFEISLNRNYSYNYLCAYNFSIGYIIISPHLKYFYIKCLKATIS